MQNSNRKDRVAKDAPRLFEAEFAGTHLVSYTVGALPIINHFIKRAGFEELLEERLEDVWANKISSAQAILVLLRNIMTGREPLYEMQEWADTYAPEHLGVDESLIDAVNDDRIGRALDRLFEVGYKSLLLDISRRIVSEFDLDLAKVHTDTTTLTFFGRYARAGLGGKKSGKKTLAILFGHNKDHRPDLKQILLQLTITEEGAVPVHFAAYNGNVTDDQVHRKTWDFLCKLRGNPDFLYVADSKLATRDNMGYIAARGGTFVTVLPRTRSEDESFRCRILEEVIEWEEVHRKENRDKEILDLVKVTRDHGFTSEGYRLYWYHSLRKEHLDVEARASALERVLQKLEDLEKRLASPRTRLRDRTKVTREVDKVLHSCAFRDLIQLEILERDEEKFKQATRGRPGSTTKYVREIRKRFSIKFRVDSVAVHKLSLTDGLFPLVTNSQKLTPKEAYLSYKKQPYVEVRFSQLKSTHEVAPVWLKDVARIEALAAVYYLATLIQALIERQIRKGMTNERIESLPFYPEGRPCTAPTTRRLLELFNNLHRHDLWKGREHLATFRTKLSKLQTTTLRLLGLSPDLYKGT